MPTQTKDTDPNTKDAADKITADIPDSFMTPDRRKRLEALMGALVQKESPLAAASAVEDNLRQEKKWHERVAPAPGDTKTCPDKY